jgi:hypothetical protein
MRKYNFDILQVLKFVKVHKFLTSRKLVGNLQAHYTSFERKKLSVVTGYVGLSNFLHAVANILCPCLESNQGQQAYDVLL